MFFKTWFFKIGLEDKQRYHNLYFKKMGADDQREILKAKLDICQIALAQLAGDITDNLAQLAATIKLQLNIMQLQPEENKEENFEVIKGLLSELIKGLQNIAGDKVNSIILDLTKI